MMTPDSTRGTFPSDWPSGHDGEWRWTALAGAAEKLSAKALGLSVSLHSPSPSCLRLDVFHVGTRLAVIFANRNRQSKNSPVYTAYAGGREEYSRCHSILRLVYLIAHASGPLPAGQKRRLLLPESLEYLQPLAEQDHPVRSGMARGSFIAQLMPSELEDYVGLYRLIVVRQDTQRISDWLDAQELSPTSGKVLNLLLTLDGLAEAGRVPADLAATRLIQWDTREHDDYGNEW